MNFNLITIPSDIYEISSFRTRLLMEIPAKKKKKKCWLVIWNQLQESEAGCHKDYLDKANKNKKINEHIENRRQPWLRQCSPSEILAWRDHLYRNLDTVSDIKEEMNSFSMCQEVYQPESRTGRKVARVGLWLALQK